MVRHTGSMQTEITDSTWSGVRASRGQAYRQHVVIDYRQHVVSHIDARGQAYRQHVVSIQAARGQT